MTEQPLRRPTVAIVGSHPRTRAEFDFDRTDCDIWVFNEAMSQEWCKRADVVFQIHQPVVWRSKTNRNDPKHYEWLQSYNTPTIIMQEQYPDVPNAERYPIEEVLALAPGFAYLTSSVAYAIALAIVKGYERIELYGAEMETNTEYGHQRQGMAFWIGIALGRGIDVEHVSPTFWTAPLYGYEGDVRIDMKVYETRIEALKKKREGIQAAHDKAVQAIKNIVDSFIKDYKTDQSQLDALIVQAGQAAHDFGVLDGAMQSNEFYLERCKIMQEESGTYLIVRQELEGKAHAGNKEKTDRLNDLHVRSDRLGRARKALMTNQNAEERRKRANEFGKCLADFIKYSTLTGLGSGIMQENIMLLQTYDRLLNSQGMAEVDKDDPQMTQDVAVLEAEMERIDAIS